MNKNEFCETMKAKDLITIIESTDKKTLEFSQKLTKSDKNWIANDYCYRSLDQFIKHVNITDRILYDFDSAILSSISSYSDSRKIKVINDVLRTNQNQRIHVFFREKQ